VLRLRLPNLRRVLEGRIAETVAPADAAQPLADSIGVLAAQKRARSIEPRVLSRQAREVALEERQEELSGARLREQQSAAQNLALARRLAQAGIRVGVFSNPITRKLEVLGGAPGGEELARGGQPGDADKLHVAIFSFLRHSSTGIARQQERG
jgi:hypothetical protein